MLLSLLISTPVPARSGGVGFVLRFLLSLPVEEVRRRRSFTGGVGTRGRPSYVPVSSFFVDLRFQGEYEDSESRDRTFCQS